MVNAAGGIHWCSEAGKRARRRRKELCQAIEDVQRRINSLPRHSPRAKDLSLQLDELITERNAL